MYTPYPKLVSELRALLRGQDPSAIEHLISDDHGKDMYKLIFTQKIKKASGSGLCQSRVV